MGKISGRNSLIWFFWCPTAIGWKSSKTDITFERSTCNSNPFRVFTRVLCSIYRRSFIEIRGRYMGRFPREWACPEVVSKAHRTGQLVVMYRYINILKFLYLLNFYDFLELYCISPNFQNSLDILGFSWFSWFSSNIPIFTNFLAFPWIFKIFLVFLEFPEFHEFSCISMNFPWFSKILLNSSESPRISWFTRIFLHFHDFSKFSWFSSNSWISWFSILWIVVRTPWSVISSFWSPLWTNQERILGDIEGYGSISSFSLWRKQRCRNFCFF